MTNKIIKFDNGLKYVHIPTKNDMISIGFVVKVGSRDETTKNNGISHFLEHMLFKGTKKRNTDKLLSELDKFGTSYNAMTSYDYTAYELHGNKQDAYKLVDIFIDLYLGANLYQKDLEKERGVIMEEYNMVSNDLDEYIQNTLMNEIFGGSSLGFSIIGEKKNILNFKRKDLVNYRNKFYCPGNTTFITVGNIDSKKMSNYLYNKVRRECNSDISRLHIIPVQDQPRLNLTNINGKGQVHITFGFHHNGYLHDEEYNLVSKIVATSLASGSSSKLFNVLRTKCGLAYNCSSYNMELEDTSVFIIKSAVDEKRCDIAIEKVLEILFNFVKKGIDNDELKRCKKSLINQDKLNQTNMDLMYHYIDNVIKDDNVHSPEEEQRMISSYTSKNIKDCCKHIFRHNNLSLVLAGSMSNKSKERIIDLLDNWYYLINN